MRLRPFVIMVVLIVICIPSALAWRSMSKAHERVVSAEARLVQTRNTVTTILDRQQNRPPDASGSFGQADAVRLVNSALIEAGLSPSAASELSLRDDPIRRQGQETGRIQSLSITLRPIETHQLGRVLSELGLALPSFTSTDIGLQRPAGLAETDTRYSVSLAFEREYVAQLEITQP